MDKLQAAGPSRKRAPGEGETKNVLGMPHIFKVSASDCLSETLVLELIVPPGLGVPPHTHTREDEFFLILEGALTFSVEGNDAPIAANVGDFVSAPRARRHGFANAGSTQARALVTITPGSGAESMFDDLSKVTGDDMQQVIGEAVRICAGYGIEFAPMG
jgi:quercetin dioxygenase-like cupin family protein